MSFRAHQSKRIDVSVDCNDYEQYDENGVGIGEPIRLVEQAHKDEVDIHRIMEQARKGIVSKHIRENAPRYMDLPSDLDFMSAQNLMVEANQKWMAVPAKIRAKFGT